MSVCPNTYDKYGISVDVLNDFSPSLWHKVYSPSYGERDILILVRILLASALAYASASA